MHISGETYKYYCDDTTNGQVYSKIQNADGSWPTTGSYGDGSFTYTNSDKETVTIGTLADGTTINKGEVVLPNNNFIYTLDSETQKPAMGSLATGYYWLASPCSGCGTGSAWFGVLYMYDGIISYDGLFTSLGGANSLGSGVRAVVSI